MPGKSLYLSGDAQADALLSRDPLALLIGMVLDQQIPLEWAFRSPSMLESRIGTLDAAAIAHMDPDKLKAAFTGPPALHRFPGSMAERVQAVCQVLVDQYGGDATALWSDAPDGRALFKRVQALPGFGVQKARIFVALLGKQLGVTPPGWEEVSTPFGKPGSLRSIADIVDAESMIRVRAAKAEAKSAAKAAAASATGTKPTKKTAAKKPAAAKRAKPAAARKTAAKKTTTKKTAAKQR